jgi:SAM-dependent methyltransferase
MDASDIHKHWTQLAAQFGADVRATTRATTPKALEIDVLTRHLRGTLTRGATANVLEVGCGNGVNCFALAQAFPQFGFDGVDFVEEMIVAARERSAMEKTRAPRFFVGDVLDLGKVQDLRPHYDVVFTDRCLINLNTLELQKKGIESLSARLRPGGDLFLIENSMTTYARQNHCRELLRLPARTPASFNLFFDEDEIRAHARQLGLEERAIEDFSSLHDLLLYVLLPSVNGGTVEYEHPLVKAAAALSIGVAASTPGVFGPFGQNRFLHWQKSK